MKALIPSRLAEIVFALVIAYFGYLHFKNAGSMKVPDFFPGHDKVWIYITGVCFVLAAVAILTDIKKTLACYLLAAMLLIFIFAIHIKSFDANPYAVLKDLAIAMGALIIGNNRK